MKLYWIISYIIEFWKWIIIGTSPIWIIALPILIIMLKKRKKQKLDKQIKDNEEYQRSVIDDIEKEINS